MRLGLFFLSRFLIILLVLKSIWLIVDLDLLDRLWLLEFGLVLGVIDVLLWRLKLGLDVLAEVVINLLAQILVD